MNSAFAYKHNFARVVSSNGPQVELGYDFNHARWPWLALPPQHPVLIEKYQYFSAVTAAWETGTMQPDKFSALTGARWHCPQPVAANAYATRGVCTSKTAGFELRIDNDAGQTVAEFAGQGAVIEDRDFHAWRQQSRDKALAAWRATNPSTAEFNYAPAGSIGLGEAGSSFVGCLSLRDGQPTASALITQANGFHPGHAYHTGSGDHVNAAHIIDSCLQMAHMLLGANRPLYCSGGVAAFFRFVELDVPFEIRLIDRNEHGETQTLAFQVNQLGRDTTSISLNLVQQHY